MNASLIRAALAALAAAAAATLGGCGGDSSDDVATPAARAQLPAAALTSPTAYAQYVGSLPATETGTPVDVNNAATVPTSDTALPLPL